jgi:hypothetical protein
MYFTAAQIARSIAALSHVHPFHGITFLACKQAKLPVGKEIVFPLDSETDKFLRQHHQIDPGSDWFFQPFKSSATTKKWVRPDYSAKGLQAINTQTFISAFLHKPGSRIWGWAPNYIRVLEGRLPSKQKIPTFDLSVWLFRDSDWPESADAKLVIDRFLKEYSITAEERNALFEVVATTRLSLNQVFQASKPTWQDLRPLIPAAPDAKPEQGGTLAYMGTRGLGPANTFVLEPASRLSLITGDNGLGKSFLLELAWWVLTDVWAGRPSYPNQTQRNAKVEITFAIKGELSQPQKRTVAFDWKTSSWPPTKKRPTIPGLIVYARVDGSFAVWDPTRQNLSSPGIDRSNKATFSSEDVWDGSKGRIEGLIRDWVRWQSEADGARYDTFQRVLARLSPPDLGQLRPGKPVRIFDDLREIPTLVHPYGEIPILYASAGVRRIVALAYLIVWAWHEHVVASNMAQVPTQRRMVVLVDEIEAHLHPRWQRSLLPALMEINELLSPSLKAQFLVATHSPLVMASAEAVFEPETDKLFHLDMDETGEVALKEPEFVRFGDVSSWLTSPVFELRHARSNEGEGAIEAAKALQLSEQTTKEEVSKITERLKRLLAPEDRFWPRWIAYAERFGVEI